MTKSRFKSRKSVLRVTDVYFLVSRFIRHRTRYFAEGGDVCYPITSGVLIQGKLSRIVSIHHDLDNCSASNEG